MKQSPDTHLPHSKSPELRDAGTSLTLQSKIEILKALIEEKKLSLIVAAVNNGFSIEEAHKTIDMIPMIVGKLSTRCRERFVTQVAMPLATREPLDLLKICLSSAPLQRLNDLCDGLPTLLVEHPLKTLSDEIANGGIDALTRTTILPIRSHTISYQLSAASRPYRKLIEATMHPMVEILDSHPLVQQRRYNYVTSTPCFIVARGSSSQHTEGTRSAEGQISLIIEPQTRPFNLATTLIREDQRTLFDLTHGLCRSKEVVPDTYRQRTLGPNAPLVPRSSPYPSTLLQEFHTTTKGILFQVEALKAGLVPQGEVASVKSRVRREFLEAKRAESLLSHCVLRRDFNRHGIELFTECQEVLRSSQVGQVRS